jgi:predicted  nucleic acid-binding Zn-ribbon protein
MTTDGPAINDNTDDINFVRPSLTIRKRHDELLDELCAARYGSRSEATRAAIESLAKSVLSDGETGIEQISRQVNQLEVELGELSNQIDEIQEQLSAGNTADPPSQLGDDTGSTQNIPAVESIEAQGSMKLQHAIYALLSEREEMSVPAIAEHLDEDPLSVHENIAQLVENRSFVTCTEQSDEPQYKIKQPNPN